MFACTTLAGLLTFFAFLAHSIFGTREFWLFKPPVEKSNAFQAWVQALAGWQFASLDLLATSVVFFLLAFTEVIRDARVVLILLGSYYSIVGTCWLILVAKVGVGLAGRWLKLGQWIFCYLIATLSLIGAFV